MKIPVGYAHPTMYLHAHICELLFQIQVGKGINSSIVFTNNAYS